MELEQLIGLVVVLGFVGFLVWKVKSKKSSDTGGSSGGGGRPSDGGKQQLK